MRSRPAA